MLSHNFAVSFEGLCRHLVFHMRQPLVEVSLQRDLCGLDIGSRIQLMQNGCELTLRVLLCAMYGVPFLAPVTSRVAAEIDHDSPGVFASTAYVPTHQFSPLRFLYARMRQASEQYSLSDRAPPVSIANHRRQIEQDR